MPKKPTPQEPTIKVTRRKLADYAPHTSNPNKHNPRGLQVIEDSINYNGAGRSGLASKEDTLLIGNGTWEAMARAGIKDVVEVETNGQEWVIVKRNDLSKDDPRSVSLMISDNRASELDYTPDDIILAELIDQLGQDDARLVKAAGFEESDVRALMERIGQGEPPGDPGAQVDKAAELQEKWQVQRGDLWAIGKHRLLCGDSTNADDVARVMAGEKAEMVWTDPPYGVSVGDKNKMLNAIARSNRIEENLENDTLDEPELLAMLEAAFDNAIAHCLAGGAWYVAAPPGPLHVLFGQCLKDRGIWRQTIQWVKNNATFAPLGVDYHWRCEPIFYGWLPGAAHRYHGGRQQDTVWEIDRPMASPEHPTMKPVELITRAVQNSSLHGDIVYDPFGGSGTTMVACEQLSRQCRMIEISEKYCAVILQRMSDMGLSPERINGRP